MAHCGRIKGYHGTRLHHRPMWHGCSCWRSLCNIQLVIRRRRGITRLVYVSNTWGVARKEVTIGGWRLQFAERCTYLGVYHIHCGKPEGVLPLTHPLLMSYVAGAATRPGYWYSRSLWLSAVCTLFHGEHSLGKVDIVFPINFFVAVRRSPRQHARP